MGRTRAGLADDASRIFHSFLFRRVLPLRDLLASARRFGQQTDDQTMLLIRRLPWAYSSAAAPYYTCSEVHRATAVTSLRGAKRTISADNRFCNPENTSVLPAISPR